MSAREVVRVGIVGGGLMGRELAAAIGRWAAVEDHPVVPRLEAVCDTSAPAREWFRRVESVRLLTDDRRVLLEDPALDVLHLAVPHHLHEALYLDAIAAGKDFLGEKPFGIDLGAAPRIVAALDAAPGVFARCSSEMPYFPGALLALETIRAGAPRRPIEAQAAFLHSSDLDPGKPINWKRQARFCGEIGVMGDLGMHVLHLPLRLGWRPGGCTPCCRTSSGSGRAPTGRWCVATPGTTRRCTPWRAGALGDRLGCATPHEALAAHEVFAAAQRSASTGAAEPVRAGSRPEDGHPAA